MRYYQDVSVKVQKYYFILFVIQINGLIRYNKVFINLKIEYKKLSEFPNQGSH